MKKAKRIGGLFALALALVLPACGGVGSGAADSASPRVEQWNAGSNTDSMFQESVGDFLGMDPGYTNMEEGKNYDAGEGSSQEQHNAGQDSSRKLIRTVNLSVETREFDAVMGTLEQRVTDLGGYIERMETYNGSVYSSYRSNRSASMTARIPAAQLNGFLNEVSEISNVTRRSENVQDVTLEYVDMASHKKTLQAEHDRLLELMEQAESIEDIITIEERLSNVRYQIESMEAQLRTYDNKVDYSTVYLDVSEVQELTPVHEETLWERISGGFLEDLKGIGNGALEILVWLLVHIPTLVLWALAVTLFVLWVRWYMKRSREKAEKKRAQTAGNTLPGNGDTNGEK